MADGAMALPCQPRPAVHREKGMCSAETRGSPGSSKSGATIGGGRIRCGSSGRFMSRSKVRGSGRIRSVRGRWRLHRHACSHRRRRSQRRRRTSSMTTASPFQSHRRHHSKIGGLPTSMAVDEISCHRREKCSVAIGVHRRARNVSFDDFGHSEIAKTKEWDHHHHHPHHHYCRTKEQ